MESSQGFRVACNGHVKQDAYFIMKRKQGQNISIPQLGLKVIAL
jgi:hypothetical protein